MFLEEALENIYIELPYVTSVALGNISYSDRVKYNSSSLKACNSCCRQRRYRAPVLFCGRSQAWIFTWKSSIELVFGGETLRREKMSSTGTTVSASDGEKGLKQETPPAGSASHLPITILKMLTFAATLSAFLTMITNKQEATIFVTPIVQVKTWSRYHYSDAFMWFVVANGIAFVYALLSSLVGVGSKSPMITKHLIILDLLVSNMIISAASAAGAVAYIGKKGIKEAGWDEICSTFDRYCDHVLGALIASFLGWLFLTIAVLLAMRRGG